MKKLFKIGIGLALIGSLVACSSDEEVAVEDNLTTVETVETASSGYESTELSENSESKVTDNSLLEQMALNNLKETMGQYMDIEFNQAEKTYYFIPNDHDFMETMVRYKAGGEFATEWGATKDSFVNMSETFSEVLGEGYSLMMLNAYDLGEIFILVTDGEIIIEI